MRCSQRHMAPADQFSLSDRGVPFKTCDTCRAASRIVNARRGHPHCAHGKRKGRCLVCCPVSAFSDFTFSRAKRALGTKLPVSHRELLGCSRREYAFYIIGQFRNGMTLANHGVVWELDHKTSIMQRNADGSRPDQATIISRFYYTNTQPVLIAEHQAKTIAERVACWRPPPAPPPVPQLTDDEFDALMAEFGIDM